MIKINNNNNNDNSSPMSKKSFLIQSPFFNSSACYTRVDTLQNFCSLQYCTVVKCTAPRSDLYLLQCIVALSECATATVEPKQKCSGRMFQNCLYEVTEVRQF